MAGGVGARANIHVEHIVCSSVSARRGGMQPANTGREEMFGVSAPIWRFLNRFGGAVDPTAAGSIIMIET
jgi:predicted RNase H-like nuclease